MDSPAHFRDHQDLLRDTDLLDNMNLTDRQTEMALSLEEALNGIQSRLDRLRAIALLRSIPELVQAPPPVHQIDTQEESPMTPGHPSPPVSPQPDLSFRDTLNEIQQRLDYLRINALQQLEANSQVRAPLQPLSHFPTLNTWEESPDHPSPVVSQDEMVIRQRGRKRLPVTWSPDIDLKRISSKSADRTPSKIAPGRLSHSARRKRLSFV